MCISGWWSEDRQFVFVHDELDERDNNLNTTLRIFDLSNLNSPALAGIWTGPTRAIDHNGFVRGNRYYMSNYERGITVLDITNPAIPEEVGFFDTFPSSDNTSFNGAWGVYPYLPSGIILASDINTGLYVLADNTTQSASAQLNFSQTNYQTEEGESLSIVVNRTGTAAVEVSYETLPGSAQDNDFTTTSGTLSWPQGDQTTRTITIPVTADSDTTEITELFFVRLFNPQGGAALASPNLAFVNITGAPNGGTVAFSQATTTARENQATVEVMVDRMGGNQSVGSIDFDIISGTANVDEDVEATNGTLVWEAGDNSAQTISVALINDDNTEPEENFIIRLSNPTNVMLGSLSEVTVTIRDDESNQAPTADIGDDREVNTRARVELSVIANDPEGQELLYDWTQSAGTQVTIDNPSEPNIAFTAPDEAGDIVLQVDVTDDFGATTTASVCCIGSCISSPTASATTTGSRINTLRLRRRRQHPSVNTWRSCTYPIKKKKASQLSKLTIFHSNNPLRIILSDDKRIKTAYTAHRFGER